jgi:hypothetical protein
VKNEEKLPKRKSATPAKMSLNPRYLAPFDLDEEMCQRDYSPNLRREVKIAILQNEWVEEEAEADRPMRPRIGSSYSEELLRTKRRLDAIEPLFRQTSPNVSQAWTLTFQAAWALYRHEENAIRRNFSQFARMEERLKKVMWKLRDVISFKNKVFDKLWKWVFRANIRRERLQIAQMRRQEMREAEDDADNRRRRGMQMIQHGAREIAQAENALEAINEVRQNLELDEEPEQQAVQAIPDARHQPMEQHVQQSDRDDDVLEIDLATENEVGLAEAGSAEPDAFEQQNGQAILELEMNSDLRREAEEERLRQLALQTIRTSRLRALGELPNPIPDSPASPPPEPERPSSAKRRLGARMSTGGKRRRTTPEQNENSTRPKLRSAIVVPPSSTVNRNKTHAKHGQHAMGSKAETVARRAGSERRNDNGREQATPAVRPGPSSTITSGALQEMSPATGAIRKRPIANSGNANNVQSAIGSNNTHAAATNPPQRQLHMAMDVDNDTSSEDENVTSSFAEAYVPTDGECESDCTIVYEENFDDEPETLTDLEEQLNGYLQQADAERAAARAQRSLRAPLPQWPARDPNAPSVTDTPPVCYRRGERFLPYDLQVIVSRDLHQFFAAQANGERPPRPRNITVEERQAVQRQLDLEAEMNERQEHEVGLEQPMREIALIDIPEPARPPPVAMPQDQPENRRNFDVPCVCCAERMVNTIFMPCRHACYCWTCAMDNEYYNETCYMCRQEPELRAHMFGQ